MVTLPKDLTMHNFQYPSYQLVKKDNVYHPLCYTRSKLLACEESQLGKIFIFLRFMEA